VLHLFAGLEVVAPRRRLGDDADAGFAAVAGERRVGSLYAMSRSKLLMNTNEVALAREVELPNRVGIGALA